MEVICSKSNEKIPENFWLVVEPTHLKNMRKSNCGSFLQSRDENKKVFETVFPKIHVKTVPRPLQITFGQQLHIGVVQINTIPLLSP